MFPDTRHRILLGVELLCILLCITDIFIKLISKYLICKSFRIVSTYGHPTEVNQMSFFETFEQCLLNQGMLEEKFTQIKT